MREEVLLYIQHAHKDLEAAKSNLDMGYYHVAVSRAYYAMFYAASGLLASKNIHRSKHTGVHSAFAEHFIKTGEIEPSFGKMIVRAFESRLEGDYEVALSMDEETAMITLQDARHFVSNAERILRKLD